MADHGQTPAAGRETAWQALANRRMLICVFIGFSSGMPLYLLLNLLSAWLRTEGVSLEVIGLFALAQFPYTWKFLWAPLLDRYALPLLGRRRSWMAATQLGLLIAIVWLGQLAPQNSGGAVDLATTLAFATHPVTVAAMLVALLSAPRTWPSTLTGASSCRTRNWAWATRCM